MKTFVLLFTINTWSGSVEFKSCWNTCSPSMLFNVVNEREVSRLSTHTIADVIMTTRLLTAADITIIRPHGLHSFITAIRDGGADTANCSP